MNNPWTAGPGSFVDALINLAGGENIGAQASASWAQFSIEEIVNSDPDVVIIDAAMGTAETEKDELAGHPVWQEITAFREDNVYIIDGDLVNRSGPRIVDGLEKMASYIHPELFQ
jgi:iron complex transport system substrate-binding protein